MTRLKLIIIIWLAGLFFLVLRLLPFSITDFIIVAIYIILLYLIYIAVSVIFHHGWQQGKIKRQILNHLFWNNIISKLSKQEIENIINAGGKKKKQLEGILASGFQEYTSAELEKYGITEEEKKERLELSEKLLQAFKQ